jgi:hypothetical protein
MKIGDIVGWLDSEGNVGKHVGIIIAIREVEVFSSMRLFAVFTATSGQTHYAQEGEIKVIG